MKKTKFRLGKYIFEFLSIFIAVISAFALNNWNDNRKDRLSETHILKEIANGLVKDTLDININISGHRSSLYTIKKWEQSISNSEILSSDSLLLYSLAIFRDYTSMQNTFGYESLKSKGLELIKNDSLRLSIINLYEYDYNLLRKFEEEYSAAQFHDSYYDSFNNIIYPNYIYDSTGNITGLESPLKLKPNDDKKLLSIFLNIKSNRHFILKYYSEIKEKNIRLIKAINRLLN